MPGTPLSAADPRLELQPGARHQVTDGAGDDDLARARLSRNARADVHGEPGELAVRDLALARVDACADLEPQRLNGLDRGSSATDRAGRSVEARKEADARGVELAPAEALELPPDRRVVAFEQRAPAPVSELCRALG